MSDTYAAPPAWYLVIDFEATCCDDESIPRREMEIIEIGAVMARADDFSVADEFQSFVRPQRHSVLTGFCSQLTSIRQHDVDRAPAFPDMVQAFKQWLCRYNSFVFCSWGDYDFNQLAQDCAYHRVPNPITAPHVNVKRLMAERQSLKRKSGLGEALAMAGLKFDGVAHRGIDDARNITRLLPYIFGDASLPATGARTGRKR